MTDQHLQESAEVGTRLLAVLRPTGAPRKPTCPELKIAINDRERLFTMFERIWTAQVWRAGAWLFDHEVHQQVPPLLRQVGHKRAAKSEPDQPSSPTDSSSGGSGGNGTPARPVTVSGSAVSMGF